MDKEIIMNMDANMLLSILNMKLRDEFNTLEDLIKSYDLDRELLTNKLSKSGYIYNVKINQFTQK
ncbi:DUF4250 domain-containing protein [Clostridium algidicarnis]|uniref:Uncharacterized protein DUF4250 n=2 Tax=Clostridium algidicarnis TaxID=37659 RepID=A0A2S6FWB6_9CLOT|nr:DUF4250 domain-containing protein [Clostridium algidicarnis]MBB6631980.1 DUF4250 domain-containing protein [Clostridium algidicarnis]MBB6697350.1 DUF4250 domain-containing protein [Clostridium algidicarnis]MBU3194615.1 DUF4250 domain-containing protein [Clostridium algidicarnis]MBU3202620.1 DUF4250 domain-containing protein [Clostridium algidicarnis]MBU3206910.1 DUF4250 domain-containing protein [Clostridium algidicarnis]